MAAIKQDGAQMYPYFGPQLRAAVLMKYGAVNLEPVSNLSL